MQFTSFALLGLGALGSFAVAAPVDERSFATVEERTTKYTCYCPKGKTSGCTTKKPSSGTVDDVYQGCGVLQAGLINILLCNILNNDDVSVPITISLLSGTTL